MRKQLIELVILVGWLAGVAAAQPVSDARALADAFVGAWNTHDARTFGRLYAADADWVTAAGDRHKGRIAIEAALGKEHESWARTTTMRATDVVVRVIDGANPIVMFNWEITRADESGGTPSRGNTLLVAAKDRGRWIILAGQVARVPASR